MAPGYAPAIEKAEVSSVGVEAARGQPALRAGSVEVGRQVLVQQMRKPGRDRAAVGGEIPSLPLVPAKIVARAEFLAVVQRKPGRDVGVGEIGQLRAVPAEARARSENQPAARGVAIAEGGG